jgi:Uma2 family endonuclease
MPAIAEIDLSNLLPASFTAPGLTEADFLALCETFPDAMLEYPPDGTVLVTPPNDLRSSARVAYVVRTLGNWADEHEGIVIGPDGGFRLPGGSRRSPGASWFDDARYRAAERPDVVFPPFAPEFVIEVRSPHDSRRVLQSKMQEYIDNGVQLAWMIDPLERSVEIYRPDREPELVTNPLTVAGEGPVAGFVLDLDRVFNS